MAAIADDLVALHSSDPVSVYLSATARMRTPSLAAVATALYDDRTVVRHHGMRRTLWVATPEVARLFHAAATRKLIGPEQRRTAKLIAASGVAEPDAWLADARTQVLAALHEHGAMTARQLGERVPAVRLPLVLGAGTKYEATQAAHTRVLLQLAFDGTVIRTRPPGTWVNGAYSYAATDAWLPGGFGDLPERAAAAALADRWLWRFGPATSADLQWWTGWTAALTRHALADCGAVPVAIEPAEGQDAVPGWLAAGDEEVVDAPAGWVALLPGLDPTTMGWKQRDWYLAAEAADLFDANGNAGPAVWADGRVVGAWTQGADGEILQRYFVDVPDRTRRAVDLAAEGLQALVGGTRFTVRFPGVVHRAMLA